MGRLLKTTDVRSRIEPEIKEHATEVLASCRLNLSDAIRLFLRQVVAHEGLPFEVKIPNATTLSAMHEARSMRKADFNSAQALFDDLDKNSKAKTRKTTAK